MHVIFLKWAESIYEISDNLCYWVIPSAHNEHKENSVSSNKDWLSERNATLVLTDELVLTSAAYKCLSWRGSSVRMRCMSQGGDRSCM